MNFEPHAVLNREEDEISLIDLVLVVVENLRLLVLGPLVVGVLAFAGTTFFPKDYESVALVRGANSALATLVTSSALLAPVARAQGLQADQSETEAVDALKGQIKASLNAKDQILTLTVRARSSEQAQRLSQLVLKQLSVLSAPQGAEKVRLQQQLADLQKRTVQLEQSLAVFSGNISQGVVPVNSRSVEGYAQLIQVGRQLDTDRIALEKQLIGLDESSVVQPPTLPERHVSPKRSLVTLLAVLASGLLLLVAVFVRQALRQAQADPASAEKVNRLWLSLRRVGRRSAS